MTAIKYLTASLLIFCTTIFSSAQTTYIHCGKLIDGKADNVQTEMTIIIEGTTITDVRKGYAAAPQGSKTIDLNQKR